MKNIVVLLFAILFAGCAKDNKTFSLKVIRLNDYRQTNLPDQKLHLELIEDGTSAVLARTDSYPSDLTLPATFNVHPSVPMMPYSKTYRIQLWGEVTGYMGSCRINMDEYKIIFPIDMEVAGDSLNVSIAGSWR